VGPPSQRLIRAHPDEFCLVKIRADEPAHELCTRRDNAVTSATDELLHVSVERFLNREARLLDDARLEEWLTLFAADGVYWMPLSGSIDPSREPSIMFDTASDRAQRVHQLLHTPHYAQIPPSRTVHQVSNLEVDGGPDGTVLAHAVIVVHELRPGDPGQVGLARPRTIAGRARYTLVRDGDQGWSIREKVVTLLGHDTPFWNFTFIF
jgi:3-phenylpropionate/cinnamic acid dioxygenase small subunit